MNNTSFFKVLKDNIQCAFCKEKGCSLKYHPGHRRRVGTHYIACKKEFEKRVNNVLKRPLP